VLAARGGKVWAAEPAQPSSGHGGRVPRREEKSGGERKGRAHLCGVVRWRGTTKTLRTRAPATRTTTAATALRAGRGSDGGAGEVEGKVKARKGGVGEKLRDGRFGEDVQWRGRAGSLARGPT
jgi:hypothetical protein